jgi:pyruvate formate lyase activating enzyme
LVLETLEYLKHETDVWFELTDLLIPGENDSEAEIEEMTQWVVEHLGPDVPMHFSAFHPDWKMMDKTNTPKQTLVRAREIALKNGVRHAYMGNVHDLAGSSTYCHDCGEVLIGRDWYELSTWNIALDGNHYGNCGKCGTPVPGVFESVPGDWGRKRVPVRMAL